MVYYGAPPLQYKPNKSNGYFAGYFFSAPPLFRQVAEKYFITICHLIK